MTIIYGLIGLSVIVFIHELGHFIAARMCGVTVESFSIGMGPILLHRTIGTTDYRISLIPLGGYCGMKGEKDFQKALDEKLDAIPKQPDSFYGVHPFKRILIAFSGPLANLIFVVFSFVVISMISYSYQTAGNRVILLSDIYTDQYSSAAEAGLQTGDSIISINEHKTETFNNILELVSTRPSETLTINVERQGSIYTYSVPAIMDPSSGAGRIGVISWISPVVAAVAQNSPASTAGLLEGDKIIAVDGVLVENTVSLQKEIAQKAFAVLTVERPLGNKQDLHIYPKQNENGSIELGIQFASLTIDTVPLSFIPAIVTGFQETYSLFLLTIKSIALLFDGLDFTKAVSGPIRITVMLGDVAQSGFSAGFSRGLVTILNFLALISMSLFIMNLLPIPVLDGGLILFSVIEIIRRKPNSPRILYMVQYVGFAFIILLAGVAIFSDVRYLFTR